jgi:hypothetical protein
MMYAGRDPDVYVLFPDAFFTGFHDYGRTYENNVHFTALFSLFIV